MRIGIIGVGNVGVTLGRALAAAGHAVTMGTRDPTGERASAARAALGDGVPVDTATTAARTGEVVIFAIPGTAMDETVAALTSELAGTVVVDATNLVGVRLGDRDVMNSAAVLADHAPTAAVVRAFNSLGWENFAEPVDRQRAGRPALLRPGR